VTDFALLNYKKREKKKKIIDGFLLNAKQDDKTLFKCLVCGKETSKTISALIKRGIDYKKIDVENNDTIFMCRKHSQEAITEKKYGVKNNFQNPASIKKIKKKREKKRIESGDPLYFLNQGDLIVFTCEVCGKKTSVQKRKYTSNLCRECKIKKANREKILPVILKRLKGNNIELLKPYSNQRELEENVLYDFKCLICNNTFKDHLHSHIPRCPTCYPKYSSIGEKEIKVFIESLGFDVIENDRKILSGLELDIYIPDKKIAIEFNGLYWHSEQKGKDKNYHLNKTLKCAEKEIQLIHFFEDEWYNKKEIVKSIIATRLGIVGKRIYARKCIIKNVTNKEERRFLEENHIQGYYPSSIKLGLYYEEELVLILTFGKSRFSNHDFELIRFANKLNSSVVGGFSKLLKSFRKDNKGSLITFSERRLFSGNVYEKSGFSFLKTTLPNYYYVDENYNKRFNRMKFQKHKLKNLLKEYNEELTEKENMIVNNYDRIWDCGNNSFEIKKL